MDVQLLVYDLSRGLAKQMSMSFLGFQLDAIYHTSIQLQGREYVYDGGIIDITPGTSHLGQPLEKIHLGQTNLPMDIIHEYLDSVRPIFTLEVCYLFSSTVPHILTDQSYDLFKHNCNNFTDAFSNFLLGKGIPSHIVNMPQAVMDSPMGQMLLPQLTQGVNASRQNGSILGLDRSSQSQPQKPQSTIGVKYVHSMSELTPLLKQAESSSAVIFFTSATCPPCKMVYPTYDQLAEELGDKTTLIKIDIAQPMASQIAQQYSIRATPTFVTFLKGKEENRWSGADPAQLRGNVQLLAQMASPTHLHDRLRLPTISRPNATQTLYPKVPPMAKLLAKIGDAAKTPEAQSLVAFIEARNKNAHDAVLPSLEKLGSFIQASGNTISRDVLFALVDLFRCSLIDPRVSGYFAEESSHATISKVISTVNSQADCPYALRLVTLQAICNLFSTPLFAHVVLQNAKLQEDITQLISSSFLDDGHSNTRVAASSLLFNVALAHRQAISKQDNGLPEGAQVELAASVVEAIGQEEESSEALHGMLLALGNLAYCTDLDGELADLLRALAAQDTIEGKSKKFPGEKLIGEVGTELLGKGLRKP